MQGGAQVRCGRSEGGRSQARLAVAHWWPGLGGIAMGAARSSTSSRREEAHEARLLDGVGAAKRSRASALVLSGGAATSRRRRKQRATRGRGAGVGLQWRRGRPGAASWRGNGAEEGRRGGAMELNGRAPAEMLERGRTRRRGRSGRRPAGLRWCGSTRTRWRSGAGARREMGIECEERERGSGADGAGGKEMGIGRGFDRARV